MTKEEVDYYLEYSSICDAPTIYGLTLDEFTNYYRSRYGLNAMDELPERMAHVEATGTSEMSASSAAETLCCNRAGKDETRLTVEQFIEWYCVRKEQCQIEGVRWWENDEQGSEEIE